MLIKSPLKFSCIFYFDDHMSAGPPWMQPFRIVELVIHKKYKKYSRRDSKVIIALTLFNQAPFGPLNIQGGGADLPPSFFLFSWTPGGSDLLKKELTIKFSQKSSI